VERHLEEDEMHGTCSTHGGREKRAHFIGILTGSDHLEDLGVEGR
jgi:hypothetical protein